MRRKTTVDSDAIHTVALNHGVPDKAVKDVMESVFRMMRKAIESADRENNIFENIHLINLGKFYVSEQKKAFLIRLNRRLKKQRDEAISDG